MNTATKTTAVPVRVSFLEGQVTFFNSVFTSLKNCLTVSNLSLKEISILSLFLGPAAPALNCGSLRALMMYRANGMAGQEGFEPPSPGFGVRCSIR